MNIRHLVATATIVSAGTLTGLSQGVASAYPYYGLTNSHTYTKTNTLNTNAAVITNNNPQFAVSGDATATATHAGPTFHSHGSTATNSGNATSGTAQNTSSLHATVGMSNSATTAAAAVAPTAPASMNSTQATATNTYNSNQVTVTNNNAQVARSGDAVTTGQRNSGNATTGTAANTSATTVSVSLSNSATQ